MKLYLELTIVYALVIILIDCFIYYLIWKYSFKLMLNYDGYRIFDCLAGERGVKLKVIWFPKKVKKNGRLTVYRVIVID